MSPSTSRFALGAGLIAAAGVAYASIIERNNFVLRDVTVPVLGYDQDPLTIVHVSDLHLMPNQAHKSQWVSRLADLEPDLIINTGDNIAHGDALGLLASTYEPLFQFPGAFVFGSNDYYKPEPKNPARYLFEHSDIEDTPGKHTLPTEELRDLLRGGGWIDLNNHRENLMVSGRRLSLVGVDDPHLRRDVYTPEVPRGSGLKPTVDLRIGVAHAPYRRVLNAMADDGAEIIFAGHTHGGQLCLPGIGALVTNCDLDRKRAKGLHGWPGPRPDEMGGDDSVWLHVSAGLGTSPYAPVRFACPPEATVLRLVPMI